MQKNVHNFKNVCMIGLFDLNSHYATHSSMWAASLFLNDFLSI